MFTRFRETGRRLQVSLIETHRLEGRVRHTHVASLGSIAVAMSPADRATFWTKLHQRLAELSNRVIGETHAAILGAVHARMRPGAQLAISGQDSPPTFLMQRDDPVRIGGPLPKALRDANRLATFGL